MTVAHQALLSMGLSRQEYCSGLPFPSSGDLPDPGIKPGLVKNPPAIQETPVRFLGWEDPPEKGEATHSSILGLPWWLSW